MSAGTLVSWLTCTGTIFTPSSLANSLPSVQDEPIHGSPEPEVFCTSQGGLLTTPTRSTPALRMASMRSLAPGSGGVWAWAEKLAPARTMAERASRAAARREKRCCMSCLLVWDGVFVTGACSRRRRRRSRRAAFLCCGWVAG